MLMMQALFPDLTPHKHTKREVEKELEVKR